MTRLFTLGCIVTGAGQINQIEDDSVDLGIEEYFSQSDGKLDPDYTAMLLQAPVISFQTTAIARALGYCGLAGLAVATPTDFYFQQLAQGGTRTAAGAMKVTGNYGLIIPTRLTADQRGSSVSYEAHLRTNDGTTAPIALAVGQSMASLTAADQMYVAGPVSINGTPLDSVESIGLEFGITLRKIASDGHPYVRYIGIQHRSPILTVRTHDLQIANVLTAGGVAQGATDTLLYLRKCAADGARVANATAEHIKLTIDAGRISVRNFGGGSEGTAEIRIAPVWDGTADIVAVNTASAIV